MSNDVGSTIIGGILSVAVPWVVSKVIDYFSGDQKAETTKSEKGPPEHMRDLHKKMTQQLEDLQRRGVGGETYLGKRVADLSQESRDAIKALGQASANYGDKYWSRMLKSPTYSETNLAQLASGQLVGKNPYFQSVLGRALGTAADEVARRAAGAGRYGSGIMQGVMSRELGDIAARAEAEQYNQDIQNMMKVNEIIDQARKEKLLAANQFYSGQSQAAGAALQGGHYLDMYNQMLLEAERERWQEMVSAPFRRFDEIQKRYGQLAQGYDVTTGYEPVSAQPMRAAGHVISNWDKFQKMGQSISNWWGGGQQQQQKQTTPAATTTATTAAPATTAKPKPKWTVPRYHYGAGTYPDMSRV